MAYTHTDLCHLLVGNEDDWSINTQNRHYVPSLRTSSFQTSCFPAHSEEKCREAIAITGLPKG